MIDLERVVELTQLLGRQAATVKRLESELQAAKEAHRETERETLPDLMTELALTEIKLDDGTVVTIKAEVDCGISAERKPTAYAWLVENGFGGLIKTEVAVPFGRGDHEAAVKLLEHLLDTGLAAELSEGVHAATLKAFIKEQMAEGHPIPMDLFGVFPYNVAKVTLPKVKRK